jgi:hypothetical protein
MADFNHRSPSNELRARLDLPERAPQSLIALMDQFNAPTAATTEAALFAAVERGIAELVHVAGRNPEVRMTCTCMEGDRRTDGKKVELKAGLGEQ